MSNQDSNNAPKSSRIVLNLGFPAARATPAAPNSNQITIGQPAADPTGPLQAPVVQQTPIVPPQEALNRASQQSGVPSQVPSSGLIQIKGIQALSGQIAEKSALPEEKLPIQSSSMIKIGGLSNTLLVPQKQPNGESRSRKMSSSSHVSLAGAAGEQPAPPQSNSKIVLACFQQPAPSQQQPVLQRPTLSQRQEVDETPLQLQPQPQQQHTPQLVTITAAASQPPQQQQPSSVRLQMPLTATITQASKVLPEEQPQVPNSLIKIGTNKTPPEVTIQSSQLGGAPSLKPAEPSEQPPAALSGQIKLKLSTVGVSVPTPPPIEAAPQKQFVQAPAESQTPFAFGQKKTTCQVTIGQPPQPQAEQKPTQVAIQTNQVAIQAKQPPQPSTNITIAAVTTEKSEHPSPPAPVEPAKYKICLGGGIAAQTSHQQVIVPKQEEAPPTSSVIQLKGTGSTKDQKPAPVASSQIVIGVNQQQQQPSFSQILISLPSHQVNAPQPMAAEPTVATIPSISSTLAPPHQVVAPQAVVTSAQNTVDQAMSNNEHSAMVETEVQQQPSLPVQQPPLSRIQITLPSAAPSQPSQTQLPQTSEQALVQQQDFSQQQQVPLPQQQVPLPQQQPPVQDVEMSSEAPIQTQQVPQPPAPAEPSSTQNTMIKLFQPSYQPPPATAPVAPKEEKSSMITLSLPSLPQSLGLPQQNTTTIPQQQTFPVQQQQQAPQESANLPFQDYSTSVAAPTSTVVVSAPKPQQPPAPIATSLPAPQQLELSQQFMDCAVSQQEHSFLQLQSQPQMMPFEQPQPQQQFIPLSQPTTIGPSKFNLTEFYTVKKRTLAFELQPETKSYRGQIKFHMTLKMLDSAQGGGSSGSQTSKLAKKIEDCKREGINRISLEAQVLAKQVKVVEVWLLQKDPQTGELKKFKQQKFAANSTIEPTDQARVNPDLYTGLSRHLYQLEDVQKKQLRQQASQGTFSLKLGKKLSRYSSVEKIKPELYFMIDFICTCDQITDVGGVKCIEYRRELADQLVSSAASAEKTCNRYFFTSDEPNQATCWLPQLVGTQKISSPWYMQFQVPDDYTVLASGKLVDKASEDGSNFFDYEVIETQKTIPDCIGFVICPTMLTSPFSFMSKKEKGSAYFVSRQKQASFCPKLAGDTADFVYKIMSQRQYPSREIKLVFLPNLFPLKFPKQAYNFAGGLHMMDQELLFKATQIDKRHQYYKQLASTFAFTFFGDEVREADWSDAWLLVGIRERIGDRFTKSKCGALLYRYQVMRRIEKLYQLVKEGIEVHPLQNRKTMQQPQVGGSGKAQGSKPDELRGLGCPDPTDQVNNDVFYRKCSLVMQMIELKIQDRLDVILKELYQEGIKGRERVTSREEFRKFYKKNCGISVKDIFSNWVDATSCPKLTLNYEFKKRDNSLQLTLKQQSATVETMRIQENLKNKLDKIFGMSPQDLEKELLGEIDPAETFNVDQNLACKRLFVGDVNIVIYQADGGGSEILKQHHKMQLKKFKSTVHAQIVLQGKVRRTQNRKKDIDSIPLAALNETPSHRLGHGGRPINLTGSAHHRRLADSRADHEAATSQAAQMMLNQDVQKFEMNEFELEDFPPDTKNIFRLDNNPVLWIRVDPDMEYIRKVKVVQKKRDNWLFQLLREQDIVGQIEAVRQLYKYNEDFVYEILKTVSKSENYFYKVRKEVLKTMHKMEISVFNEYLSHEAFLVKIFREKHFDEVTGFYRENNFQNLLQYYLDRSVLKHISKCKEEKLVLTPESRQKLDELQQRQSKLANEANMEDADDEKTPQKDVQMDEGAGAESQQPASTVIQINFASNQVAGLDAKGQKKSKQKSKSAVARRELHNMADYRVTTTRVAEMLLKVLEQNDNSENYFDDSFFIRDILASLGRLDNPSFMARISAELLRQFKLDQISNSSPQFATTIGAIKGYFNQRKQIFRFKQTKQPHIDPQDPYANGYPKIPNDATLRGGDRSGAQNAPMLDQNNMEQDQIAKSEDILDEMKCEIDRLLMDPLTPLQLRLFIFDQEIKNIIFYRQLPFVKAFQVILDAIYHLQAQNQVRFATFCLRDLAMFLESVTYVGRINFTELHVDCEATKRLADTLWSFMTFWVKRLINRFYGKVMPKFLTNQSDMTLDPSILQYDEIWKKTEADIEKEEQVRAQQKEKQNEQMIANAFGGHTGQLGEAGMISTAQVTLPQQQFNFQGRTSQQQQKLPPSKRKLIVAKSGDNITGGDEARGGSSISITQSSRPAVTIKATNNGPTTSANSNILTLNTSNTGQQSQTKQTTFSIQDGATAKFANEMREVNMMQPQAGNPSTDTAMVHIGPQTHSAITLPLGNTQQQQQAESQGDSAPVQLVVLRGTSVDKSQDFAIMDDQELSDEEYEIDQEENQENAPVYQQDNMSDEEVEDNEDQEMQNEEESKDDGQDGSQGGEESREYDPFAEETFEDRDMQKCWLILGKLYYHYEVTDFLEPVTLDTLGEEIYQEYCTTIAEPMDISTVMQKMRDHMYPNKESFRRDIDLIFDNCREFNEAGTEIVHCANSLTIEFESLWQEFDMN